MNAPTLTSTAFLTGLLGIGLFFFIRASTKDRTEVVRLLSTEPETSLLERIQAYFTQRAYRIAGVDAAQNQVKFEGFVRPSLFLALFLTGLAAIAILCLSLVFSMLFPAWAPLFPALVLAAPVAGIFYWKKAGRSEQVLLRVDTITPGSGTPQQVLTVTAHRDELAELQRCLKLEQMPEG